MLFRSVSISRKTSLYNAESENVNFQRGKKILVSSRFHLCRHVRLTRAVLAGNRGLFKEIDQSGIKAWSFRENRKRAFTKTLETELLLISNPNFYLSRKKNVYFKSRLKSKLTRF